MHPLGILIGIIIYYNLFYTMPILSLLSNLNKLNALGLIDSF